MWAWPRLAPGLEPARGPPAGPPPGEPQRSWWQASVTRPSLTHIAKPRPQRSILPQSALSQSLTLVPRPIPAFRHRPSDLPAPDNTSLVGAAPPRQRLLWLE